MQLNPPTACTAGRFALPALLLFSLLAAAALLYPFSSLRHSLLWQAWMDFAHFPLFLVWQCLLAAAGRALGWRWAGGVSAVALLVLAAVVEVVQARVGRSLSLHDWLIGALGAGCGWWLGRWPVTSPRVLWIKLLPVAACTVLAAWPALRVSQQVWQDYQQLPALLVLEPVQLPPFWHPLPDDIAATTSTARLDVAPCDQQLCLLVTTVPKQFSGVARRFEFADWRAYQWLQIRVRTAEPLDLNVRIDDARSPAPAYAERFNGGYRLPAGEQDLRIPLQGEAGVGRQIDLAHVRKLALFVAPQPEPVSFRLLQVTLE